MSYLDEAGTARVTAAARAYGSAEPFPHLVVDGLLRPEIASALASGFPPVDAQLWKHHLHRNAHKFACNRQEAMPALFRQVVAELNAPPFLRVLEEVTGIGPLLADPDLEGGGLHQIQAGGFLKVHADFNRHTRLDLERRLNAILYLNKDWHEDYGGHLQIWDNDMTRCEKKVLPVFNRLLVFATLDNANHGHPDPLTCPPDRARRSMALYYYTSDRPEHERQGEHTTVFRQRPGEEWTSSARQVAKRWTPPALVDLARSVRTRGR